MEQIFIFVYDISMELSAVASLPKCLFCEHDGYKNTSFEDTVFNNKTFKYLQCTSCCLVYVNPLPDAGDLIKMYPVEYQGALVTKSTEAYKILFEKIKSIGQYKTLLDYGCGGGRFVIEALEIGYDVSGVEYNPNLVKNLKIAFSSANFLTINDFYKIDTKYDIIFLSNVLEHLTNPREVMLLLKTRLNPDGIFVLEGPVENNLNLANCVRKVIFFIRKNFFNKIALHAPLHVLYSNKKNQEVFFKSIGLKTLYYKIDENHWPFPSTYKNSKGILQKIMFLIADISIRIGKNFNFWGNNFQYIAKVK